MWVTICNLVLQYRSSHQTCSINKGALKNFAKFRGKHLHESLVFNQSATLFKKETLTKLFSCEFFTGQLLEIADLEVL